MPWCSIWILYLKGFNQVTSISSYIINISSIYNYSQIQLEQFGPTAIFAGFCAWLVGTIWNQQVSSISSLFGFSFSLKSHSCCASGLQFLGAFGLWYLWFLRTNIAFQDSKLQKTTQCEHRGTWSNMIQLWVQHDPTMGPNSMAPKVTEFAIRCFSSTDPSNHSWSPWTTGRTWKRAWWTPKNAPGVWPNLLRCHKHVETSRNMSWSSWSSDIFADSIRISSEWEDWEGCLWNLVRTWEQEFAKLQ